MVTGIIPLTIFLSVILFTLIPFLNNSVSIGHKNFDSDDVEKSETVVLLNFLKQV